MTRDELRVLVDHTERAVGEFQAAAQLAGAGLALLLSELRGAIERSAPAIAADFESQVDRITASTLRHVDTPTQPVAAPNPSPPPAAAAVDNPVARAASQLGLYTEARDAIIRARYPLEGASNELIAALNTLPGKRYDNKTQLQNRACQLCVKLRPEMRKAATVIGRLYTPARDAMLRERYPAEGATPELLAALNQLPGDALTNAQQIWRRAEALDVKRAAGALRATRLPKAAMEAAPVPAAPAPPPASAPPPKCEAVKPVPDLPRPVTKPVRFAAPAKPLSDGPRAPLPPSAAQRRRDDEAAAVAAHIATKGVTRCPAAAAEATTARIPADDLAALRAHQARLDEAATAIVTKRVARVQASKAAKLQRSIKNLAGRH